MDWIENTENNKPRLHTNLLIRRGGDWYEAQYSGTDWYVPRLRQWLPDHAVVAWAYVEMS